MNNKAVPAVAAETGDQESKKYYGGTVTVDGRILITSLMAGETIEFTRVMVGSGEMPEGVEPIDMTDLVEPVAEAVSTLPSVENGVLYLTVEYRNDLNGGLKNGFWLREFGVYAKTESSPEILLYYATLGDSPQPVNAYQDGRIDIRRYPISIALELDADIQVSYNPGAFITADEAQTIIGGLFTSTLEKVKTAIIAEITLPASGWTADSQSANGYGYYLDVPIEGALESQFPCVAIHKGSLETARDSELCPTSQTLDGILRFWAKSIPAGDIFATAALITSDAGVGSSGGSFVLPVATATRLGGVKIGPGVSVTEDGTISVDLSTPAEELATPNETAEMLDEVFPDENDGR